MESHMTGIMSSATATHQQSDEEMMGVRKGPWTAQEDSLLKNYVNIHGEGHWNAVAHAAGLKRTGKSCRLRWLNYLRPDVRRGDISLQEQLMILQLHSQWGNRWSKIAQHLPGRTDNEIKNYWRTRVQKQAKQLKCDVNSQQFRDAMHYVWMPRLLEQIQAQSDSYTGQPASTYMKDDDIHSTSNHTDISTSQVYGAYESGPDANFMPEISGSSSESFGTQFSSGSDLTDCQHYMNDYPTMENTQVGSGFYLDDMIGSWNLLDNTQQGHLFSSGGDSMDSMWSDENLLFLQQPLL